MAKTGLKHIKNKEYVMMDVEQLIIYAKDGNELAYTILFDKYYMPLKMFISSSFANMKREMSEDVDDICMDTFNKAFMNIESFDTQYKFSTWLYKIGENCMKDFLRRSRNAINDASTSSETKEVKNMLSSYTPEDNLIESQQITSIMDTIGSLPPKYKEVMLLYIEGYALDDIAEELGITLANTKIRVKRGKDLLAEALKDTPLAQKRSKKTAEGKKKAAAKLAKKTQK